MAGTGKTRVARILKEVLYRAGFYERVIRERKFPGLLVLCYHGILESGTTVPFRNLHVERRTFEAHCRLLQRTCQPVSLEEWVSVSGGRRSLPPRPVLLTFDDGYASVESMALPVLRENGVPALVLVTTGPVETKTLFWHDSVARLRGERAVEELKGAPYEVWVQSVRACELPFRETEPHRPLSVEALRALARSGLVEIGSHTVMHPILARAPLEVQRKEILASRAQVEAWVGEPVRAFAYPNGRPGIDYTNETLGLVAEHGMPYAFTTAPGFVVPTSAPLELPRFLMLASVSPAELAHRLAYSFHGLHFPSFSVS